MARTARKKPAEGIAQDLSSIQAADKGDGETLTLIVGRNVKRLRLRRNLSLEGLSRLCGVSRAMLGQIELGRSVPTINIVWKIANAFAVPFSTLVTSHEAEPYRLLPVSQTKILSSASGEFSSRALFPFDGERQTEFYEIRLKPGGIEHADSHAAGTMENLVVVKGALEIKFGAETLRLSPGDAILFQADTPHSYSNTSKTELLAYLVMTYVEPGL
jgi:transcriptional regulator with XRE-family HTH domain